MDHTCYLACDVCLGNIEKSKAGRQDLETCAPYQAGEHSEWGDCDACQDGVTIPDAAADSSEE